ncbi:MAG: sulfite exporter TauE/SafE family protein [Myxococcaceae bacterium]
MDLFGATGAIAALVIGLSGSAHCAVMCGPLACAAGSDAHGRSAAWAWHLGRFFSYGAVGALAGGFGRSLASYAPAVQHALPWLMAAGLLLAAFGPTLPGASKVWSALARPAAKFSPLARAGAWGALTPLLPCGLLYGVVLTAASTGSTLAGAAVMAAFTLGSLPALSAVQLTAKRFSLGARGQWVRRGVLLVAATVLAYRGYHAPRSVDVPPACHTQPGR